MKFQDAKDRLKELAKGQTYALLYNYLELSNGTVTTKCNLYISGYPFYEGSTWGEALASLEAAMMPKQIEEIPDVGDGEAA